MSIPPVLIGLTALACVPGCCKKESDTVAIEQQLKQIEEKLEVFSTEDRDFARRIKEADAALAKRLADRPTVKEKMQAELERHGAGVDLADVDERFLGELDRMSKRIQELDAELATIRKAQTPK